MRFTTRPPSPSRWRWQHEERAERRWPHRSIFQGCSGSGSLEISAPAASQAFIFFRHGETPELLPLDAADCAWGRLKENNQGSRIEARRLAVFNQSGRSIHSSKKDFCPKYPSQRSLSPRDHKSLSRSVLILDAVARRWDMSDATLRAWRNHRSQPLRRQIRENEGDFPALCLLLLGSKLGVQVVINDAARELATIWSQFELERHSEASVISALEKFLPIDRTLDKNASVRIAFEKAREILRGNAG